MTRSPKPEAERTAAQRLSSVIKGVCDIIRKNKGLSGDAERWPILTWLMFLNLLGDLEQNNEAEFEGRRYRPVLKGAYRWWGRATT